jgi:hypothetical protein
MRILTGLLITLVGLCGSQAAPCRAIALGESGQRMHSFSESVLHDQLLFEGSAVPGLKAVRLTEQQQGLAGLPAGRASVSAAERLAKETARSPDAWLMVGIGIGLIAFRLRRKQQMLERAPFAI